MVNSICTQRVTCISLNYTMLSIDGFRSNSFAIKTTKRGESLHLNDSKSFGKMSFNLTSNKLSEPAKREIDKSCLRSAFHQHIRGRCMYVNIASKGNNVVFHHIVHHSFFLLSTPLFLHQFNMNLSERQFLFLDNDLFVLTKLIKWVGVKVFFLSYM